MASEEQSVDVNVDVSTAYTQWTRFEEFADFIDGVESVTQRDDKHLRWVANVGGQPRAWDVEITEQVPNQLIAWRGRRSWTGYDRAQRSVASFSGEPNGGEVTLQRLGSHSCRVTVRIDHEPEGLLSGMLGVTGRQIRSDLERFKEIVERGRQQAIA